MLCDNYSKNRPKIVVNENIKPSQFLKTTSAKHAGCGRAFNDSKSNKNISIPILPTIVQIANGQENDDQNKCKRDGQGNS